MHIARRLFSNVFSPQNLTRAGSLLNSAGPWIDRLYRRLLFRVCGSFLAAAFYARANQVQKIPAIARAVIAALFYRQRVYDINRLPASGCVVVCNHTCIFDAIALQLACGRPVHALAREMATRGPWINPIFDLLGAKLIPVSNERPKEAICVAVDIIRKGGIVCVYPEGELNRTGSLLKLQTGFELISRLAECPVVPVWLNGLSDSIFSYGRDQSMLSAIRKRALRGQLQFGESVPADRVENSLIRQKLLELGERCTSRCDEVNIHLGRAAIESLKRLPFSRAIFDPTKRRSITRLRLLGSGIAVSRLLAKRSDEESVALYLPPGPLAVVANVALALAGKCALHLDVSEDIGALRSAIDAHHVTSIISCTPFAEQLSAILPNTFVHALEEKSLNRQSLFWQCAALIMPVTALAKILRIPRIESTTATSIFHSSAAHNGNRGVSLSHRTLKACVAQTRVMLNLKQGDKIICLSSCDPQSSVLGLWFPLIEGIEFCAHPNRKGSFTSGLGIQKSADTILVGSSISLRVALDNGGTDLFKYATSVVALRDIAENAQEDKLEERIGKRVYSIFGLERIGPILAMSLPDSGRQHPNDNIQQAHRLGSVGKSPSGLAVQIRNEYTGEVASLHESGILWIKGAGLSRPDTNGRWNAPNFSSDDWIETGERARFDEDGFLFLESRDITQEAHRLAMFQSLSTHHRRSRPRHSKGLVAVASA